MSEYSELIKRFDKIRDYMRDFYVYGFMARNDFKYKKSLRSYDNEKRRIESYLAEYMSFRMDENGKNVFLSVDSSEIPSNPLYRAFKAKSFTKNDITLHFIILDILFDEAALSATEIADMIAADYLSFFEDPIMLDVSTVRNKLSEYEKYGILFSEKQGKKLLYGINDRPNNLNTISDALAFFSEVSPLGVIGSYLLDQCDYDKNLLSFKHHYIMHALESEIVYELLQAIHKKQKVEISNHNTRSVNPVTLEIIPLRFLVSVQGGRRYLAAFCLKSKAILSFRLDYIKSVKQMELCDEFDQYYDELSVILEHTWGTSFGRGKNLEHLTMVINIAENEEYIIHRIKREGRHGTLTKLEDGVYQYEIAVYNTNEMIPWLRTFIGRIISLECDNQAVVRTFYKDLNQLYEIYGGESDAF